MRWAARERPAYFYSIVIGLIGPIMVVTVPSIRYNLGDKPRPPIPQSYPSEFAFRLCEALRNDFSILAVGYFHLLI